MELNKSLGYELSIDSGREVLHKTLAANTPEKLAGAVMADIAMLISKIQVADTLQNTAHVSRLVGYSNELAKVLGSATLITPLDFKSIKIGGRTKLSINRKGTQI